MNIDQLAADIGSRMVEIVEMNTAEYLIPSRVESLFDRKFNEYCSDVPEWKYEAVYTEVYSHPEISVALSVIREQIREFLQDEQDRLNDERAKGIAL